MSNFLFHARRPFGWPGKLLPLVGLCALGLLAQPVDAQVLRLGDKPTTPPASPTSVKLTISAAAEPSPALRYRFWVSEVARRDGNAITNMFRANALMREVPNRQQVENRWNEKWNGSRKDQPIDQFPKADAHEYLNNYRKVLKELAELDNASRVDYELMWKDERGPDVFAVVFPEVQQARQLAGLITTQARLATAEGRYEDAIQAIRLGFRLSEVVSIMGRSFLIGKLVALSICSDMLSEIEVLIQQPGAPNLYWAIASWPNELDTIQSAIEGERLAMEKMFHRIIELPAEEITNAAWQSRVITSTRDFMQVMDPNLAADPESNQPMAAFISGCVVLMFGDDAKEKLRNTQSPDSSSISYSEALVRQTRHELLQYQSEYFKWTLLAPTYVNVNKNAETVLEALTSDGMRPAAVILRTVLPSAQSIRDYHRRVINARNRLITIESLRAYAATHNNSLPEALPGESDGHKILPAWKTAIDGQVFQYSRTSPTQASLIYQSPWPVDVNCQTEITLRK